MKWALTVLLLLSAPIALYCLPVVSDLPNYVSEGLAEGDVLTSSWLWNFFLRILPILWVLCMVRVVVLWLEKNGDRQSRRSINTLVGCLLVLLTALTALFVYVFWAWGRM